VAVDVDERAIVEEALRGDANATRRLVKLVLPVIQARLGRVLARRRARSNRDVRQEIEDLAQEVFVSLFEREGRTLRAWDPSRGLSLASFCGLIAEREAASILRSGRRSPWTEDATDDENLEKDAGRAADDVEGALVSRDHLLRLVDRLREELSPLGLEMFQRLLVDEESVDDVCAATSMKPDAVYAWKSRLSKLARKVAKEIAASEPQLKTVANTAKSEEKASEMSETGATSRRAE
jgi:DNA-directed RNA polymerase specialized sigma24 family protein